MANEEIISSDSDTSSTLLLERLIQNFLSDNLDLLGLGELELIEKEHQVPSGRIDILARSADQTYIVIEIKRGIATRESIGQLQGYIGDLMHAHFPSSVRGVLVALDVDQGARSALLATPTISYWQYGTTFTFQPRVIARPADPVQHWTSGELRTVWSSRAISRQDSIKKLKPTGGRLYCKFCKRLEDSLIDDDWHYHCANCKNYI